MENSNGRTTYTIIYKLINLKDYKEFPSHNYVPIYLAYSDIDTDFRICYFFMLSKKFSSLSSFTIICKPLHFLINLLKHMNLELSATFKLQCPLFFSSVVLRSSSYLNSLLYSNSWNEFKLFINKWPKFSSFLVQLPQLILVATVLFDFLNCNSIAVTLILFDIIIYRSISE